MQTDPQFPKENLHGRLCFLHKHCKVFLGEQYNLFDETKKQKQPFIGVLIKKCSENMQEIYSRTPMPKCDYNKIDLQKHVKTCKCGSPFGQI